LYKDKVYKVLISGDNTNKDFKVNEERILYTCPVFNEFWDKNMYLMNSDWLDYGSTTYESDEGLVQDYS
jgi:hypothetical protein